MCNRVATPDSDELQGYFDKQELRQNQVFTVEGSFQRYYNADGFALPHLPFTGNDTPNIARLAMWKLLPFWVKDLEAAKKSANTLNARSEDIFTTASYKDNVLTKRGLLWVNGFFEPNHPNPKVTIPYYLRSEEDKIFSLGCVFNDWVNRETAEVIRTCSIITTPPNELLKRIHNEGQRMPLIVTSDKRQQWLSPMNKDEIIGMMQPLPDGYLQGYPVSNLVYKRGVDTNVPETQIEISI